MWKYLLLLNTWAAKNWLVEAGTLGQCEMSVQFIEQEKAMLL